MGSCFCNKLLTMAKDKKRKLKSDTNRLFEDQVDYLNDLARKKGTGKAALIRQAIDDAYDLPKPESK